MNKIILRPAKKSDANAFLYLLNALADYEKLKRPTSAAKKRLIADAFSRR